MVACLLGSSRSSAVVPGVTAHLLRLVGRVAAHRPRQGIRVLRLRLKGVDRDYEVDFRDEDSYPRSLSVIAGAFTPYFPRAPPT